MSFKTNVSLSGNKIKDVKELTDEMAVQKGANFLGEAVIYSISALVIVLEVSRSTLANRISERNREKVRLERHAEIIQQLSDLRSDLNDLNDIFQQKSKGLFSFNQGPASPLPGTTKLMKSEFEMLRKDFQNVQERLEASLKKTEQIEAAVEQKILASIDGLREDLRVSIPWYKQPDLKVEKDIDHPLTIPVVPGGEGKAVPKSTLE